VLHAAWCEDFRPVGWSETSPLRRPTIFRRKSRRARVLERFTPLCSATGSIGIEPRSSAPATPVHVAKNPGEKPKRIQQCSATVFSTGWRFAGTGSEGGRRRGDGRVGRAVWRPGRGSASRPMAFSDRNLNLIAVRAFERVQFIAGALSLYAENSHRCSAFGAVGMLNRIPMRCRRPLSHWREHEHSQPPTPDPAT
jgi:hypothetical protein